MEMKPVKGYESDAVHAMFLFHESVLGFTVENEPGQEVFKTSGPPHNAKLTKVTGRESVSSNICSAAYLATPL
jgi:hypothetical protein